MDLRNSYLRHQMHIILLTLKERLIRIILKSLDPVE